MDIQQIGKRIKNSINFNTPSGLFAVVLTVLIVARFVYILLPTKIAWDASVYIGMAKYLTSFGQIGLWEYFRPPILPILFSVGGFIHLPIIAWAQFLTFLASIGSLYLIYKIGETIRPFAGVFSSIALGVSTLFFSFSNVPMTEIFGVFFSLLALFLFLIKKNYFLAGLISGLCFLTRFPYGLLAPIFCFSLFYFDWKDKNLWRQFFKKSFNFSVGFLIVLICYLMSNYFLYGDFFSPLLEGVKVIGGSIWIYERVFGFYENVLFLKNPLFIFSIVTIFMVLFGRFFLEKKRNISLFFIWCLVFFVYFVNEVHKEERYIITIFPAISLLSGISISYFYEKYKHWFFYTAIICLSIITFNNTIFFVQPKNTTESFENFYSFLNKEYNKIVITSSPMLVAYSPVKIIPAYDRWEFFKNLYEQNRLKADFLLIDSCELHVCPPGDEGLCKNYEKEVLNMIYTNETIVYNNTVGVCNQIIAKIKKDPVVIDPVVLQVNKMSLDEKIGQLLIVGLVNKYSDSQIQKMIKQYHIGGVNLLGVNVKDKNQVKKLISDLQKISTIPLFIGTDQEGGTVIRFKFLKELTSQLKIANALEAEKIAFNRAVELKELGVNMNFSPVVDYVSDIKSYLYKRTFGANPDDTGELANAMVNGYFRGGVIAVAKHFPGYGNVVLNPHRDQSVLNINVGELETNLISFKKVLANKNIGAIMTAHIVIPEIDSKPATLSSKFITGILRDRFGFKGVVITDDIEMVSAGSSSKQTAIEAIQAGDDMIIDTATSEKAIAVFNSLKKAVLSKEISEERINQSVIRILNLKSSLMH